MQLLNLVDHLSANDKEVSFYFSGVQERFSMIKKSAKFENDMLKIKEDMVQDILWFHTTGSFFFSRVAGCFGVGQRYAGNRAWKVSVTQRGFRKVVAEDFTDESDSSLWNLTRLLVVRRSFFFSFLLNTPCQKLEKPFEGTICDVSILCRKLWQMSATVYKRTGRSFFFSGNELFLFHAD